MQSFRAAPKIAADVIDLPSPVSKESAQNHVSARMV